MDKVWAGIDAGKEVHWASVLDASGTKILSRRVENEEVDLSKLIDEVLALAEEPSGPSTSPGAGGAPFGAFVGDGTRGSSTSLV